MVEREELIVGRVYETTIGMHNVGKAVYLGKAYSGRTKRHNVVIYRNRMGSPDGVRFAEYSVQDGRLVISEHSDLPLPPNHLNYIEDRLNSSRILKPEHA